MGHGANTPHSCGFSQIRTEDQYKELALIEDLVHKWRTAST